MLLRKNSMKKSTLQRGFTLIELLVVIAIVGLLSSIVLASLKTARDKAIDAKVLAEVHQFYLAAQLYNNDYGGFPVCPSGTTGGCCVGGTECTLGGVTYNSQLTALITKIDAESENQLASYMPSTLGSIRPFAYYCGNVDSSSGTPICVEDDAIVSYTVNNTEYIKNVKDLTTGTAPSGGGSGS